MAATRALARPFVSASARHPAKWRPATGSFARSYATTSEKDELVVRLQSGLKDAMRAKDKFKSQVLKSALADIQTFQHQAKPPPTIQTLLSSLSKRKEALKVYSEQSRDDLVEQFKNEVQILEEYVPEEAKELTLEQLEELVSSVMKDLGIEKGTDIKSNLNKVIKEVRTRAGLRAQNLGKQLAESVKQALS